MIALISVCVLLCLLNLVGLAILFKSIYVTNVKIEEDIVYKKSIKESLDDIGSSQEVIKSHQSIIIDTLKRIVDLL
jgi:hypothetical protein